MSRTSFEELCAAVKAVTRANGPRPTTSVRWRSTAATGSSASTSSNVPTHVAVMTVHMGAYIKGAEAGASLITSSWEKPSNRSTSLTSKVCGNYVNSIIAKKEAMRLGADEAIMLNHNGTVAEGSAENLFMVRKGKISTPGLSEGILEGITRDTVMHHGHRSRLRGPGEEHHAGRAAHRRRGVHDRDGRRGARGPLDRRPAHRHQGARTDHLPPAVRVRHAGPGEVERYAEWIDMGSRKVPPRSGCEQVRNKYQIRSQCLI